MLPSTPQPQMQSDASPPSAAGAADIRGRWRCAEKALAAISDALTSAAVRIALASTTARIRSPL